jgi:hypothetical protein
VTQASTEDFTRGRAEQLADYLRSQYDQVRVLPDGSVAALGGLMFTTAIFTACNSWGFERRFCFEDRGLALQRFAELQHCDDEPQGYIARRGI